MPFKQFRSTAYLETIVNCKALRDLMTSENVLPVFVVENYNGLTKKKRLDEMLVLLKIASKSSEKLA